MSHRPSTIAASRLAILVLVGGCGPRTAAISGRAVLWGEDAPLGDVEVVATCITAPPKSSCEAPHQVRSDADGNFLLASLQPGATYEFTIHKEGWITKSLTTTARVDGESSRLMDDLVAHDPPDVEVRVLNCLSLEPVAEASVTATDKTAAADAEGNALLTDLAPGSVEVQVTAAGYAPSTGAGYLPDRPPFKGSVEVQLCPIPAGSSALWVQPDSEPLTVVPAASVADEDGGQRPYFGADELAVNTAWYLVDADTPVIPHRDVRAAPATGSKRRLLVAPVRARNRQRGWLAARVIEVGAGEVPAPSKTDGLYREVPAGKLSPGGYVGPGAFGYFAPGDDVHVWTRFIEASGLVVQGVPAPEGYMLLELPEDGLWALIPAAGSMPWPIYLVMAGGS